MNTNVVSLKSTVSERVRIAVDYLRREFPNAPLTVARVCKVARVNRGNLYVCHPQLVQEILGRGIVEGRSPLRFEAQRTDQARRDDMERLARENKALLLVVLEQNLKIRDLTRELANEKRKRDRR